MKKLLYSRKIGMTELMLDDGNVEPVTLLSVLSSSVILTKTVEKDGYSSVLIGADEVDKLTKPLDGFFRKHKTKSYKILKEVRQSEDVESVESIGIADLENVKTINVRSKTIGRGFTGTIKRHNFSRGPMTHGSKSHRIPGSIGGGTSPGRVMKGKKMAGHFGNEFVTVKNLQILKLDSEKNLIFVKGSVPGKKNNLVEVRF